MDLLEILDELDAPEPRWSFTLDILTPEEMQRVLTAMKRMNWEGLPTGTLRQWRPYQWAGIWSRPDHIASILAVDLSCRHYGVECQCVGDRLFRLVCHSCWRATVPTTDVEDHVVAWHDHAWPGWRELPTVTTAPVGSGRGSPTWDRWAAEVSAIYPDGWADLGAPILTRRPAHSPRSVPDRNPWSGYDMDATRREDPAAVWA